MVGQNSEQHNQVSDCWKMRIIFLSLTLDLFVAARLIDKV